jgi:hypothetical protein
MIGLDIVSPIIAFLLGVSVAKIFAMFTSNKEDEMEFRGPGVK